MYCYNKFGIVFSTMEFYNHSFSLRHIKHSSLVISYKLYKHGPSPLYCNVLLLKNNNGFSLRCNFISPQKSKQGKETKESAGGYWLSPPMHVLLTRQKESTKVYEWSESIEPTKIEDQIEAGMPMWKIYSWSKDL